MLILRLVLVANLVELSGFQFWRLPSSADDAPLFIFYPCLWFGPIRDRPCTHVCFEGAISDPSICKLCCKIVYVFKNDCGLVALTCIHIILFFSPMPCAAAVGSSLNQYCRMFLLCVASGETAAHVLSGINGFLIAIRSRGGTKL
jgi:hypothetical protein